MPTLQNGQLLPKDEIFQDEIPMAPKDAYECSDPQAKQVEHASELYTINGGDRCKLLILRLARVLARGVVWSRIARGRVLQETAANRSGLEPRRRILRARFVER